jgi:ABC-type sugar transport system ATPase subunit
MKGPLEAKANGVVFIHQELSLAQELSVAENIYLGELPKRASAGRLGNALRPDRCDPRKAQGRLQRANAWSAICPSPTSRWSRSPAP